MVTRCPNCLSVVMAAAGGHPNAGAGVDVVAGDDGARASDGQWVIFWLVECDSMVWCGIFFEMMMMELTKVIGRIAVCLLFGGL